MSSSEFVVLWLAMGVVAIVLDGLNNRLCNPKMRYLPIGIKALFVLLAPFVFVLALAAYASRSEPARDATSG
jgi:hypothetical protein